MSGPAFRFLHTSDWLLHQVCYGFAEVPEPLRDALIDAPFQAAQRVCDAAVAEQVHFVLLSGDILNPLETGPRGIAFMLQQFERLEQHGISVYWAGGRCDSPERWPSGATLPPNVSVMPKGRVEEIGHFIGEQHACTVVGRSWSGRGRIDPAEFASEHAGSDFRIGLTYGETDGESLAAYAVNYWALGGQRRPRVVFEHAENAAVYPGTPQGRCPADQDAHGCTIVQVDAERHLQLQHVPLDGLRWRTERLALTEGTTRKDIERRMRERGQQLALESGERPVLVTWRLEAHGRLAASLRHGGVAAELKTMLNQTLGMGAPSVWTLDVEVPPQGELPAYWYDEDSILGDFLRAVRQFQSEQQPLRLHEFAGRKDLDPALQDLLQVSDHQQRSELLREVALLGAELLRGDS